MEEEQEQNSKKRRTQAVEEEEEEKQKDEDDDDGGEDEEKQEDEEGRWRKKKRYTCFKYPKQKYSNYACNILGHKILTASLDRETVRSRRFPSDQFLRYEWAS